MKLLSETVEPRWAKSNKDRDIPRAVRPYIENVEPKRNIPRSARDEPK
jgi:hypothetical protein